MQITNLKGRLKSSRIAPSEFNFPFVVEHVGESRIFCFNLNFFRPFIFYYSFLVCLTDSILAFHEHGVQGRSFIDNQVKNICSYADNKIANDFSRFFIRLLRILTKRRRCTKYSVRTSKLPQILINGQYF